MTFSMHFNCIQGAKEIDGLDSAFDDRLAHSVLALACSAVSKYLHLFMLFMTMLSRSAMLSSSGRMVPLILC